MMKLIFCFQANGYVNGYVLSYFSDGTFSLKEKFNFKCMNLNTDSQPDYLFLWKWKK